MRLDTRVALPCPARGSVPGLVSVPRPVHSYQHHAKLRDEHGYKARRPPFKGAGGARTPMWESHVELNLGHGHGRGAFQQHVGPHGRLPHGQDAEDDAGRLLPGRRYPLSAPRQQRVDAAWRAVSRGASLVDAERLRACYQARRVKAVMSRQKSEAQAQEEMLLHMAALAAEVRGEAPETPAAPSAPIRVGREAFTLYCQHVSSTVSDDGFFALLMHNEWPA